MLSGVIGAIRQFAGDVMALLAPGKCAACGVHVDNGHSFCMSCDFALDLLEQRPQCLKCGTPVAVEGSPCQRCLGRGYRVFDRVVRLGVHESPMRELVVRYKFYHGWPIGELMADRAMRLERVRALLDETDVLVPVPLHPMRQIARGFNQAEVFARRIGKLAGKPIARPAIRTRATAAQSLSHSKADRIRNLRSAFALVSEKPIVGKRVTIVDDVLTTASTVKSLARALRPARPAAINVLTIAIADPTGRSFEAV